MIIKYNETKKDRILGLQCFFNIKNFYGSSTIWLIIAVINSLIAYIEIVYKIHIIGIGYLGLFVSFYAIWLLGVKRYLDIKKFKVTKNIFYEFDFNKKIVTYNNINYFILSYYICDDGFLIEYEKGYIFLYKNKLDNAILEKLNIL